MGSQTADRKMEAIGGVIYTKLQEAREPLSLQDLCANTAGLRHKAALVAVAVHNMCEMGIATVFDNKFCLTERVSKFGIVTGQPCSQFEMETSDSVFIGAVGGNGNNNSGRGLPMAASVPTGGAVEQALRDAPLTRGSYRDIIEHRFPKRSVASGDPRSQGRAISNNPGTSALTNVSRRKAADLQLVNNQDSAVAVRTDSSVGFATSQTSSSMAVVGSEQDKCLSAFVSIIEYLRSQESPVKGHVIAKGTGIGQYKHDVNRYLHCLKKNHVLEQIGAEWQIKGNLNISDEDLTRYAAVLAGTPLKASKASASVTEADGSCPCPTRGSSCHHIHNIYSTQNNFYIGDIVKSDVPERPGN